MKLRKITSLTMLVSFVLLVITSVILYIMPHGRVAYWADWHFLALDKPQWCNLHINLGLLFLLAGFLHIFFNWKPILAYMKNRARELKVFTADFNVSLLLTLVVAIGTLLEIPPMSSVIRFGDSIKDSTGDKLGEPPYGHAELTSLKVFAKRTGLDLPKAMDLLMKAGIQLEGESQSILSISKANNTPPNELAKIMAPAKKQSATGSAFPEFPPGGFGRKTLTEICSEYSLDTQTIVSGLGRNHIKAQPQQSIMEIAEANNMNPHDLFEAISELLK